MKVGDLVRDTKAEWRGFGIVVKIGKFGVDDKLLISVIWPADGGYRTCGDLGRYEAVNADR